MTLTVDRNMTCDDESTIGALYIDGKHIGRTLELPYRNNEPMISAIPAGTYKAFMRVDGKRGWRIQLKDVQDRAFIQIHVGNYQDEIEGCILLGDSVSKNGSQCMVTNSRNTVEILRQQIASKGDLGNMTSDVEVQVIVK